MCRFHVSFIVLLVTTTTYGQLNLNLENLRYGFLLRSPQRGVDPVSPYSPASIQIQNRIRSLACELSNNEICPHGGSTQQSCENAGCCWHQHSGSNIFGYYSRNGWCYKRASVNDVTTALMRQYKFQLPGFNNPFQRYMAVKDYVHCTLSKPVTTYIISIDDCRKAKITTTHAPVSVPTTTYIISIDDCRKAKITTTHAPVSVPTTTACSYHLWSGWSACTQKCKETVRTRNRKCSCASQDMCVGVATETIACNNPTVHDCGYWTSWTSYGSCSVSCFQGVQVRTRNCEGGTAGQGSCQGPSSESKPCHGTAQSYMQFGDWGQCSVTCGEGTHTRVAHSQCGQPDKIETKPCQMPVCCGKLNWGPWSTCAHNNGRYIRARSRADKCKMIPLESEIQECQLPNTAAPPAYYYPQTQLYIHQRLHHNVPLPGQPQPNHGHLHNVPNNHYNVPSNHHNAPNHPHHNTIPLPGHGGAQNSPQQPQVHPGNHNVHQPQYVVPLPVNQPLNKIPYPESLNAHNTPVGARDPIYVVPNQPEPTNEETKLLEQQRRLQQLIAEKKYKEAFEYQQSIQSSYSGILR